MLLGGEKKKRQDKKPTVCCLTNHFVRDIWKEGQTKGICKVYTYIKQNL